MKFLKIVGALLVIWALVGVIFESAIGYFQPAGGHTLVITTTTDGEASDRVLTRIDVDGTLYVAANHWPRAWYRAALENPRVEVQAHWDDAASGSYMAVPVEGEEHDLVQRTRPLPLRIRVLTGFPPRHFLRLDPVEET